MTEFKLNDLLNTDIFNKKKKGGGMDTQTILRFINGASNILLLSIACLIVVNIIYKNLTAIKLIAISMFTKKEQKLRKNSKNALEKIINGTRSLVIANIPLLIMTPIMAPALSSLERELIKNIGALMYLTGGIEILASIKLIITLKEKI